MAVIANKQQITVKDTAATLAAANRIYASNTVVIESDTDVIKVADGKTAYNDILPWTVREEIILDKSFKTTGGMTINSNTHIKGKPGVVVTCDDTINRSGFVADNATNIIIEGVTFDLKTTAYDGVTTPPKNDEPNFTTAIDFRNCTNIWIINCKFINTGSAHPDWTMQATNFQNVNGLYMFNNWSNACQYKLCGASASLENVYFVGNYGKLNTQMGMSFVVQPATGVNEVASLQITAPVTADGNVTVTLDGVATNIAVDDGTAEVASLQITAAATASDNVTVTLDGVATTVAILSGDTAIGVADKIRAATFTGWTTGGTAGTDTVTFTANTKGVKADAAYNAGTTGATGTMTTTVQGVNADTAIGVADKIRATAFTGWTTGGTAATDTVTFTATTEGNKTDATYSAGTTGATGTMTTTTQGSSVTLRLANINIVNNVFEDTDQHAIYGGVDNGQGNYPGTVVIENINIEGNQINRLAYLETSQTSKGILLNLTRTTRNVNVENNQIFGPEIVNTGVQGIQINTSPNDTTLAKGISVKNNKIYNTGSFNIFLHRIDHFTCESNYCEVGKGVRYLDCTNGQAGGNYGVADNLHRVDTSTVKLLTGTDTKQVKVTAADTTEKYLSAALSNAGNVQFTQIDTTGNITLKGDVDLSGKADATALTTHTSDTANPHAVTKAQVGLGNADNTSDLNKPVSTATQTALDAKADLVSGKVPIAQIPDSVVGQLEYQGAYDAATNTPALPVATSNKGHYYVTSVAGTQQSLELAVGDWIVSNGTAYEKIDNTDAVASVFGRMGAVTAQSGDYNAGQITETATAKIFTDTERTKLTGIEANANNYVHPSGDGNLHVPATSTTNNTRVLKAGATAGAISWGIVDWTEIGSKPTTFTPSAHSHTLSEVTDAGTSAGLNVAATGDAAAGEVVKGNDTRLTNARTPTAHDHDDRYSLKPTQRTLTSLTLIQVPLGKMVDRVHQDIATANTEAISFDTNAAYEQNWDEVKISIKNNDVANAVRTFPAGYVVSASIADSANGSYATGSLTIAAGKRMEVNIAIRGTEKWVRIADVGEVVV